LNYPADPEEAMLAAALEYSATGSCPVVASTEELTRANALGNQESAASTASNQTGEALLSIDNPNTRRNTFILHNKVNEPVIEERE
jgi:hypothetical protein